MKSNEKDFGKESKGAYTSDVQDDSLKISPMAKIIKEIIGNQNGDKDMKPTGSQGSDVGQVEMEPVNYNKFGLSMVIDLNLGLYSNKALDEKGLDQKKTILSAKVTSNIETKLQSLSFVISPSLENSGVYRKTYIRNGISLELIASEQRIDIEIVNPNNEDVSDILHVLSAIKMETEHEPLSKEEIRERLVTGKDWAKRSSCRLSGECLLAENKDLIIQLVTSKSALVRREAITALGRLHSPESQDLLIEAIFDPDEHASWRAALETGKYQNEKTLTTIKKLLDFKSNIKGMPIKRRWELASVMMKLYPSPEFRHLLEEGLRHNNLIIKTLAIINCGRIKAFDLIKPLINDKEPAVRESVMIALSQSVDPRDVLDEKLNQSDVLNEFRSQLLNDPDEYIRKCAQAIFGEQVEKTDRELNFELLEKSKKSFEALAIGDAFGAPFEFTNKEGIIETFGDYSDEFQFNANRPVLPGQYTDDTEETLLLSRSIKLSRGFEPSQFARLLGNLMFNMDLGKRKNIGYGKNTIKAARLLYAGVNWRLIKMNFKSNGGAMRMLPLAIRAQNTPELLKQVETCSRITHGHPEAIVGAQILAVAYRLLLEKSDINNNDLIKKIIDTVETGDTPFRSLLEKIQKLLPELHSKDDKEIETIFGSSSDAKETILFSLAMFFKYRDDYLRALNQATRIDGDSDSMGAIVSTLHSLSGSELPEQLRKTLYNKSEIDFYSQELFSV